MENLGHMENNSGKKKTAESCYFNIISVSTSVCVFPVFFSVHISRWLVLSHNTTLSNLEKDICSLGEWNLGCVTFDKQRTARFQISLAPSTLCSEELVQPYVVVLNVPRDLFYIYIYFFYKSEIILFDKLCLDRI